MEVMVFEMRPLKFFTFYITIVEGMTAIPSPSAKNLSIDQAHIKFIIKDFD